MTTIEEVIQALRALQKSRPKPSETELCTECRWHETVVRETYAEHRCRAAFSPVTGEVYPDFYDQGVCEAMRLGDCGWEARLFEPKEQTT